MIGDLCNPLNPGESDTVRIIMNVYEANQLLNELQQVSASALAAGRPIDEICAISRILTTALAQEQEAALPVRERTSVVLPTIMLGEGETLADRVDAVLAMALPGGRESRRMLTIDEGITLREKVRALIEDACKGP